MTIDDGNNVRPAAHHLLEFERHSKSPLLRTPVHVIDALYLWSISV